MNKTKRAIIQRRTNMVRKLVSQITPFAVCNKWLNKWYVANAITPLQMAVEVFVMRASKLHAIYRLLNKTRGYTFQLYGDLFDVKFPMCAYVCNIKNVSEMSKNYNDWCYKNNPEYIAVETIKYAFTKRCGCCQKVYYNNPITSEQFEVLDMNPNINTLLEDRTWIGEIMSCCEKCSNSDTDVYVDTQS